MTNSAPDGRDKRPKLIDLSLPQVMGGALAAMTAATLGSRLGVTGTVIGAAVASVIAAVAGALYTGSLRRTHAGARTVFHRVRRSDVAGIPDVSAAVNGDGAGAAGPATLAVGPATTHTVVHVHRRVHPLGIAVGALATLLVAAGGITGLELVSGHSLTGGSGTTVHQASSGNWHRPVRSPGSGASGERTATPSQSPTTGPSTPAPTPSGPPTPSGAPSAPATAGSPAPSTPVTPAPTQSSGSPNGSPAQQSAPTTQPSATATGEDTTQSLGMDR